jgi:hypothetical protein
MNPLLCTINKYYFFVVGLGFEHKASHLQSRYSYCMSHNSSSVNFLKGRKAWSVKFIVLVHTVISVEYNV